MNHSTFRNFQGAVTKGLGASGVPRRGSRKGGCGRGRVRARPQSCRTHQDNRGCPIFAVSKGGNHDIQHHHRVGLGCVWARLRSVGWGLEIQSMPSCLDIGCGTSRPKIASQACLVSGTESSPKPRSRGFWFLHGTLSCFGYTAAKRWATRPTSDHS
jgi:hypothetical protein